MSSLGRARYGIWTSRDETSSRSVLRMVGKSRLFPMHASDEPPKYQPLNTERSRGDDAESPISALQICGGLPFGVQSGGRALLSRRSVRAEERGSFRKRPCVSRYKMIRTHVCAATGEQVYVRSRQQDARHVTASRTSVDSAYQRQPSMRAIAVFDATVYSR